MPLCAAILVFWMTCQPDASAYVGQSLDQLRQNTQLVPPPPEILEVVEGRPEKELPGTLFFMGYQDEILVFFCVYNGFSVREFYHGLSPKEALKVLTKSGIERGGELSKDHHLFSGKENCADYYPQTGALSVFNAAHGLKFKAYNQKRKKNKQPNSPSKAKTP
ncbi:MAG: hypothetical protein EBZ83_06610 [Verrucomicrobia bacterium]|nr:hypothetical protein [Verrucomicrobiota bacterium]NBU68315.1 hypothetical protein [Verrucomicrobiota bacterium]NDC01071.1 hypothetical protein [Verrucomicrobiota bacterium]